MNKNKKIIVCMSGGIDSSICAFLLKKKYLIEGLFMKNWEFINNSKKCTIKKDYKDVIYICKKLKIFLHIVNFSAEYWDKVLKRTIKEFIYGNTPNPDILCNKEIKFKLLTKYAFNILNADYIATGHYVRSTNNFLIKSIDLNKDQSYFLYNINKKFIKKIIFPIGSYKKFEVRKIAKNNLFKIYNKKDSYGVCFIQNKKFISFLKKFIPLNFGKIQTRNNFFIGKHIGFSFYTIGQRYGFNINKKFNTIYWYIIKKNLKKNLLYVTNKNNKYLYKNSLITKNIHWIYNPFNRKIKNPIILSAKIRYRQIDQKCLVYNFINYIKVYFLYKQRSITEGQSIVLYKNNLCLGGALIKSAYNRKEN
ncbi:tRNA-specific 2-thiouridylase MnmA [Candidatus Portiera aleyrodidarum]|uniref:tRNA 2-thiouridine(34) synthase MnmA n=1 Tax=Candidatus Portiera aleyrodidarum TaxID=91844 RepID=UPI0005D7836F|nr:tRNA 2-thiouridine(34) synthase MnmA [Candidatus Portiera aleyrodidarum]CEL12429.1 tRNA-specific 2-thiouridylase MnmA [Candidatus Portiera aleyrodidarum]